MTLEQYTVQHLNQAQNGDNEAREILLDKAKPFIQKTTIIYCNRSLEWGRDDELSIALLAFNEAIDRYQDNRNIPFLGFARLVIKSRLADHFRKEARHKHQPLEYQKADNPKILLETEQSWENYIREAEARERQEEVMEFQGELSQYGITVSELVDASPKHKDSRENLIAVAQKLVERPDLIEQLIRTKRLPIKELEQICSLHRKTLEKGRRYIIAMALLLHYKERFIYFYSYLKLTGWPSGKEGSNCG